MCCAVGPDGVGDADIRVRPGRPGTLPPGPWLAGSAAPRRRVLGLHTHLMLREIQEAAGPENTDELMRVMAWFTTQGTRGIDAYTRGHAAEHKRRMPFAARARALTMALLADAPWPRASPAPSA